MAENGTDEQRQKPEHGEFCWTELGTTDLSVCGEFYAELFGWKINKSENPDPKMDYREFTYDNNKIAGGMYEMKKEIFGDHLPPAHWLNYIAVDDVDVSGARVLELGGKLVSEFIDIPHVGRMCVVEDPTGAKFALITMKT